MLSLWNIFVFEGSDWRLRGLLALVMFSSTCVTWIYLQTWPTYLKIRQTSRIVLLFLTSWKPKLSDSQFCAIICSFIRRHNVKLKYYAVIFIKLHQNQSGRQGISTSKDKSSQNLRFFKKASFLNYRLYRSYLTNCALLDIVVITHWEMKWNNFSSNL